MGLLQGEGAPVTVVITAEPSTFDVSAPPHTMTAVVADARNVPSARREEYAAALAVYADHPHVLVVRTCHRVEAYVAHHDGEVVELPAAPAGARHLQDVEAVRHLVRVACGLESAVLGEDQVLHQIRVALAHRQSAGPLDPVLGRLAQVALHAGKQAHTLFGNERRSLADLGLDEIERRAGSLTGREVLVVGAGSMGSLAARGAARRGIRVAVANRTTARADALAALVGGRVVDLEADEADGLDDVAGVIVATSGRWQPDPYRVRVLADGWATVVDLSSPQATPPDLAEDLGRRFVGIDDLAWSTRDVVPDEVADQIDAITHDAGAEYCHWLRSRVATPTLSRLADSVESRRTAELDRLLRRLPDLDPHARHLVETMTHRLVAGILHGPRTALRDDVDGDLERAVRTLFGLDEGA
ncbi:MAG TPA: NAD(P)-binding domain-containing protein [Candidatus Nanopelagicales bacterium]|nr:NAD(P)-binding domain-containing protein [Candidatus Nanopelagicales bacterium]